MKGGAGGTCKMTGRCKGKSQGRRVLGKGASHVLMGAGLACARTREDRGLEVQ